MRKMMTFGLLVLVIGAMIIPSTAKEPRLILGEEIGRFIKALVEKNETVLVKEYLESSENFTHQGRLNDNIYRFLYYGNTVLKTKPVGEIFSLDDYRVKIIWQNDAIITLLISSANNFPHLEGVGFLEKRWMKDYVACEFIIKDDKLVFYQNVCFAETGGPFHAEYDF